MGMDLALAQTNRDLLHQVKSMRSTLQEVDVPRVLEPYRASLDSLCDDISSRVERNFDILDKGIEALQLDVLHATSTCSRLLEVVNNRLAAALVRVHPRDYLALSVVGWLHEAHDSTRGKAFAVSSGQFAVYPHESWPVVYYVPTSSQNALRYLPLLFHEFGHVLYALRKLEMDDLVEEFQIPLKRMLSPRAIRDGQPTNDPTRRQVLTAWHDYWTQEVFCDAVGLTIGGPGFLQAFSHYFRFRASEDYFQYQDDQLQRRHPVTALRVELLLERAERLGLGALAADVRRDWRNAAKLFGVTTDYQGVWDPLLSQQLHDIVDDMIVETKPFDYRAADDDCPQPMINADWQSFCDADSIDYLTPEQTSIDDWIRAAEQKFVRRIVEN